MEAMQTVQPQLGAGRGQHVGTWRVIGNTIWHSTSHVVLLLLCTSLSPWCLVGSAMSNGYVTVWSRMSQSHHTKFPLLLDPSSPAGCIAWEQDQFHYCTEQLYISLTNVHRYINIQLCTVLIVSTAQWAILHLFYIIHTLNTEKLCYHSGFVTTRKCYISFLMVW